MGKLEVNKILFLENIHVIGMTATIGNLEEVSRFLKAESYSGTFRPVQLHEYVKCKDDVFGIDWKKEELFIRDRHITSKNPSKQFVFYFKNFNALINLNSFFSF